MRRFVGICLVILGVAVLVITIAYLAAGPVQTATEIKPPVPKAIEISPPHAEEIAKALTSAKARSVCADAAKDHQGHSIQAWLTAWLKEANTCYLSKSDIAALNADLSRVQSLSAAKTKWTPPTQVTTPQATAAGYSWIWVAFAAAFAVVAAGLLALWPSEKVAERNAPSKQQKIESREQPTTSQIDSVLPRIAPAPTLRSSTFTIEAMVAAGPRKSVKEYNDRNEYLPELCEDAAGVVALDGAQAWWLCDGTGDGDFLPPVGNHPGISTRMLARELGSCFVQWCSAGKPGGPGASTSEIFVALNQLWQKRVDTYLAACEAAGQTNELFAIGAADTDRFTLKWSSTFLGGYLQHDSTGKNVLTLYHAGDSGALVVRDGSTPRIVLTLPNPKRVVVQRRPQGTSQELRSSEITSKPLAM